MNKSKYTSPLKTLLMFSLVVVVLSVAYFYVQEKRQVHFSNLIKYHTKMIKSGSISSLVQLGKMYENGDGVEKDLSKAQELFKKAINYNKYLDEIYPSYSENDSDDNNDEYSNKQNSQLKNIITSVKENENTNKVISTNLSRKSTIKPKYVPYVKKKNKIIKNNQKHSTFNSVVVFTKVNTPGFKKRTTPKNTVALRETTNNKIKYSKKRQPPQKRSRVKTTNKSKISTKKPDPLKSVRIKPKKSTLKKYNLKNKKTTTAVAHKKPNSKPKNKKYKKSVVVNKSKPKIQAKPKLQAKRSPTLFEERNDYESEFSIFSDEDQNELDDDDIITLDEKTEQKETIGTNFTSNPCATASARYIAKCRRINKNK